MRIAHDFHVLDPAEGPCLSEAPGLTSLGIASISIASRPGLSR